MIGAGSPIASLVHDGRWVVANFKETQVGAMQAGQRASVWVDAFPGVTFEASVESMAGATGSQFALLPPDNASGNFTKVVQRVPVRLHLDAGEAALRPGMNVTVEVDTGSSP
ncbi:MAG TPA: HlyD family efflux transporter periplasmic adaptor subunit [Myxococcota bacterium]|nr:HlyD family efflux transporter periplasmic adaptor subunit [Myxococcota bacterium]